MGQMQASRHVSAMLGRAGADKRGETWPGGWFWRQDVRYRRVRWGEWAPDQWVPVVRHTSRGAGECLRAGVAATAAHSLARLGLFLFRRNVGEG
jgi:hypothetical protein